MDLHSKDSPTSRLGQEEDFGGDLIFVAEVLLEDFLERLEYLHKPRERLQLDPMPRFACVLEFD